MTHRRMVIPERANPPHAEGVPDGLWPTDNDWDIPTLVIQWQADAIDLPVIGWSKLGRRRKGAGATIHFYIDDYKFSTLWKTPQVILDTRCVNIVEPNFSTNNQMPLVVGMYQVYRKRWLARYYQSKGLRVFVDLCVTEKFRKFNMLGVPDGWRAYATRAFRDEVEILVEEYDIAVEKAGTTDILMLVIGGGEPVRAKCKELAGVVWVNEKTLNRRIYESWEIR